VTLRDSLTAGFAVCNDHETPAIRSLREDLRVGTMAGKAFANHLPQWRTA